MSLLSGAHHRICVKLLLQVLFPQQTVAMAFSKDPGAIYDMKFKFSSKPNEQIPIFSGKEFYDVYKDAEFLKHSDNIETILSKGYELRKMLKQVHPGSIVSLKEMFLEKNTPLLVKRTGPNVTVENYEFTANRLSGLVAAYAFENRAKFPIIKSSEAHTLGLTWDNESEMKCRLFLSAVTGTEHFYEQFSYWPLVCAIRKFGLKKMTLDPVVKIAKVKNPKGLKMTTIMMRNLESVKVLWKQFPGATLLDLQQQLEDAPQELKKVFFTK